MALPTGLLPGAPLAVVAWPNNNNENNNNNSNNT